MRVGSKVGAATGGGLLLKEDDDLELRNEDAELNAFKEQPGRIERAECRGRAAASAAGRCRRDKIWPLLLKRWRPIVKYMAAMNFSD